MKNFILIALFIILTISCFAVTNVIGNVYGTWDIEGSPYLVFGDLSVPQGYTLEISPGVVVIFQGHYQFHINGRILAVGTPSDSILITSSNYPVGWGGFTFDSIVQGNLPSRIEYCIVSNGNASGYGNVFYDSGGAFFIRNINEIYIQNNRIEHNVSNMKGGAIFVDNSSATIKHNLFYYNSSTTYAGAIWIQNSNNVSISYNRFVTNSASERGGALYFDSSTFLQFYNNLIANNSAGQGGALYSCASNFVSMNNTISNNYWSSASGILLRDACSPQFINNIIWNNHNNTSSSSGIAFEGIGVLPLFKYCNIQGGITSIGGYVDPSNYINNIDSDPLFIGPSNGEWDEGLSQNFRLLYDSPCVDSGDPVTDLTGYDNTDLDGNNRIMNSIIDMGAYECLAIPYIQITNDNTDFGIIYVGDTSDLKKVKITNIGNSPLQIDSLIWTNGVLGFNCSFIDSAHSISHLESDTLFVWLQALTIGNLVDTLLVYNNSDNLPLFSLTYNAIVEYVPPKLPENILITQSGYDMHLTWDAVTEDIHDNPITPDCYLVLYSEDEINYWLHGVTTSTNYIHYRIAEFRANMFYHVIAYKDYGRGNLQRLIGLNGTKQKIRYEDLGIE